MEKAGLRSKGSYKRQFVGLGGYPGVRGIHTKETAYLREPSLDSPFGPQVCLWRLGKRQLGSGAG